MNPEAEEIDQEAFREMFILSKLQICRVQQHAASMYYNPNIVHTNLQFLSEKPIVMLFACLDEVIAVKVKTRSCVHKYKNDYTYCQCGCRIC